MFTCIPGCAAGVYCDIKLSITPAHSRGQVNAVHITIEPFAEYDAIERLVKFDRNLHQILFALNIKTGDLWHIRLSLWPWVIWFISGGLDIGWSGVVGDSNGLRSIGLLGRLWVVGLLGCLWSWLVCWLLRGGLVLLLGLGLVSRLGGLRDICGLGRSWPWLILGLWWWWPVLRFLCGLVDLLFWWLGSWLVLGWSLLWGWRSVLRLLWRRWSLLGWGRWSVLGLLWGRRSLLWRLWSILLLRSWTSGDNN